MMSNAKLFSVGDFDFRYIGTFLDKFEQKASGEFARLQAEKDAGVIPESIPLKGFGDLLEKDGVYDNKHSLRLSWDKGPYRVSLTGLKKGSFVQTSLGTKNGVPYLIPSMTTMNLTMSYDFDFKGQNARVRFSVKNLNDDENIDGILVQLPLPNHIDENSIINTISPSKDVDGFSIPNVGLLSTSGDGLIPCTPLGCLLLLKDCLGNLTGKTAVIVRRSNIVGKPMASLLLAAHCTVTVAHSRTKDLTDVCRQADILIAAVGRAEMIQGDWIKPGATVIDVGINRIDGENSKKRLVGDVEFASASAVAGAITPVPGGVGPMTIACLLRNTVQAACAANGVEFTLE